MRLLTTTLALAAVSALGGCGRGGGKTTAVVPPAVPPAVTTVDAGPTPAVPRPTRPPAVLSIDGRDTPFPAAKLVLSRTRGGLHALLCSDDPPAAMESGYNANSFLFDMRLPADRVADLPATPWDFDPEAATADADGIFLHGERDQLRPAAGVRVTFQKDGRDWLAFVSGPFIHLDARDPSAPPDRVQVDGCLRCLAAER